MKINATPRIYQPAFSVSNPTTNRSLTFYEKDLDLVIKDIYQRILGLNYYTHPTTAGYKHILSGGSAGQILKWSAAGTAQWSNESGYTHPTTSGNKHIPSGSGSGQILRWSSDGTARWGNETAYTHPTSSGYKHIPSGGTQYDVLGYGGSGGTASWVKNTKTSFFKTGISITDGYYLQIAKSLVGNATPANSCGSALITVTAYYTSVNSAGNEVRNRQTIVFRWTDANGYYGGNNRLEVIQNATTENALFNKIVYRYLNGELIYLVAARSVSTIYLEVTVDSSLSGGKPMYVAEYASGITSTAALEGTHGTFETALYENAYTSTHRITSGSVAAGSTTLANNEVLIKY